MAPADPIEIRLYAASVVYHYRTDLPGLSAWVESVTSTGTECLRKGNEESTPLMNGLREVYNAGDCHLMARAMPGDSGITTKHIEDYTKRFCRKKGLPGVKADWDACGGWRESKPPPRVLTCARKVAQFVNRYRNELIKQMYPKGKQMYVSPEFRSPDIMSSPTKRARMSEQVDSEEARSAAKTARAAARQANSRLKRVTEQKNAAMETAKLAEVEAAAHEANARMYQNQLRALRQVAARVNAEVVEAHDVNASAAAAATTAQGAIDSVWETLRGGAMIPNQMRLAVMQLLAHLAPPAAAANAPAIFSCATGASTPVKPLSVQVVKNIREEMATASEILAFIQLARYLETCPDGKFDFINDGTSIDHVAVVAAVAVIDKCRLALGIKITKSTTAEGEIQCISDMFETARARIKEVRALLELRGHGDALGTLPSEEWACLSRMKSCTMDQCNQAKCLQVKMGAYVEAGGRGSVATVLAGAVAQDDQGGVVASPCHNHLNATTNRAACAAVDAVLKELLADAITAAPAGSRAGFGGIALHMRARWKEFGASCYPKGHWREFLTWLKFNDEARKIFYLPMPRAQTARFHWLLRAAYCAYWNRKLENLFLMTQAAVTTGAGNKLVDCLRGESCVEYVAVLRCLAIIYILFERDLTFLTSSKGLGWGQGHMAHVNQAKLDAYQAIAADPSVAMDPDFDPWATIVAAEPLFEAFRDKCNGKERKSADKTKHNVLHAVKKELMSTATDPTNVQSTDLCLRFLRTWALAAIDKMRSTPTRDFIDDGKFSVSAQAANSPLKAELAAVPTTSDSAESVFATAKNYILTFIGVCITTAFGVAVGILNGAFARPAGAFLNEHVDVQNAILDVSRGLRMPRKAMTAADLEVADSAYRARRAASMDRLKNAAISQYLRSLRLHAVEITFAEPAFEQELGKAKDEKARHAFYKKVLSTLRYGWGVGAAKCAWTRRGKPVPSAEMRVVLAPLLTKIRSGEIVKPAHAHGAKAAVKTVAQLGTEIAQMSEIKDAMGDAISVADIQSAALALQAKGAEKKAARDAKMRDPGAMAQTEEAPQLVAGLCIQTFERLSESNTPFWAACEVIEVADGTNKYMSKNRKVTKGRVLIGRAYADGSSEEEWVTLKAANFNCSRVGGWCVDLGDSSDEEVEIVDAAADGYDTDPSSVSSSESDSE